AAELAALGLDFHDQIARAADKIKLAIGAAEVIQAGQLDAGGAQAQFEVFPVGKGVEAGLRLQRCLVKQPGGALKLRDSSPLGIGGVGEIQDRGVQLVGVDIHRRIGAEIAKGNLAVNDAQLVEGTGQQGIQRVAPIPAFAGL